MPPAKSEGMVVRPYMDESETFASQIFWAAGCAHHAARRRVSTE